MSKRKRGRRRLKAAAVDAIPSRGTRRRKVWAVAIVLCVAAACVAGAAQWGLVRRAGTNAPLTSPAQGGGFSPSSPSKEYIYAGGRLVATEEPAGAAQAPFGGVGRAVPGTIQSEDFDEGGEGVAYHDTDPTDNVMNAYRPDPSGVDLEACGDAGGGYNVGYAWVGEWMEYTVEVASSGVYTLEARVAYGAGVGGTFHVEFDGVDKTGPLTVPNTGGWQNYQTVTKAGVSLTAGTHVMRVALDPPTPPGGGFGNFNYFRLTSEAVGPAPTGLVAAGASTSSVTLNWAAPSGSVLRYQVERNSGGGFALVSEPTASPYTESGLAPDTSHLYRVRAVYAGGYSNFSDADLATTVVFTDNPLQSGTTIKAVHLNELRRAVGAVRALAALGPASWTYPDPVSTPAEQRRRIYLEDVTELRARLDEALTALGRYTAYPADPPLVRYATVRKEFFVQIRVRVE